MFSKRWLVAMMLAATALAVMAPPASARIKLATLPVRERVEIQLENENATLVEEERVVTLLKGTNQIDFSWTNTQIDKWTILFRPLAVADTVRVINQSYPPGENALVWEVFADKAGPVKVRISYIIGNLRRSFSYRATAEADESSLVLRNYMKVQNFSGEEFGSSAVYAGFAGDQVGDQVSVVHDALALEVHVLPEVALLAAALGLEVEEHAARVLSGQAGMDTVGQRFQHLPATGVEQPP